MIIQRFIRVKTHTKAGKTIITDVRVKEEEAKGQTDEEIIEELYESELFLTSGVVNNKAFKISLDSIEGQEFELYRVFL